MSSLVKIIGVCYVLRLWGFWDNIEIFGVHSFIVCGNFPEDWFAISSGHSESIEVCVLMSNIADLYHHSI